MHSLQTIKLPNAQSNNKYSFSHNDILSYDFSSFASIDLSSGGIVPSALHCNNILAFSTNHQEIYLYDPNDCNVSSTQFQKQSSSSSYFVSPIQCKINATILCWKPNSPTFVTAMDNGHISMWSLHYRNISGSSGGSHGSSTNESKRSSYSKYQSKYQFQDQEIMEDNVAVVSRTYTNNNIHERRILSFILWNEKGTCLISGDDFGLCCIWKPTTTFTNNDNDNFVKLIPLIQIQETNSPLLDAVFVPFYSSISYDSITMLNIDSLNHVSLI